MKILAMFVILSLCAMAYADSDAIGVIAGTQEPLSLALYNSSGSLDSGGTCNISIYGSTSLLVNESTMAGSGGIYWYDWNVSTEPGIYRVLMRCTSSEGLNFTSGGALTVAPRSFEKSVAHGEAIYLDRYITPENQKVFGTDWNTLILWGVITSALGSLLIYYLYSSSKRKL